ncbi:MAG: hypothetical protein ACO32I_05300 [Candidatus Limnocylindrus sp.]|jgi:hypothetical protein
MNVFEAALKEIVWKRQSLETALCGGQAEDFPAYKGLAGEIRGLSFAEMVINDLVRKLENGDE